MDNNGFGRGISTSCRSDHSSCLFSLSTLEKKQRKIQDQSNQNHINEDKMETLSDIDRFVV